MNIKFWGRRKGFNRIFRRTEVHPSNVRINRRNIQEDVSQTLLYCNAFGREESRPYDVGVDSRDSILAVRQRTGRVGVVS